MTNPFDKLDFQDPLHVWVQVAKRKQLISFAFVDKKSRKNRSRFFTDIQM